MDMQTDVFQSDIMLAHLKPNLILTESKLKQRNLKVKHSKRFRFKYQQNSNKIQQLEEKIHCGIYLQKIKNRAWFMAVKSPPAMVFIKWILPLAIIIFNTNL